MTLSDIWILQHQSVSRLAAELVDFIKAFYAAQIWHLVNEEITEKEHVFHQGRKQQEQYGEGYRM